jgi:hypothetical protein
MSLTGILARADSEARTQILKERDAVLSQILADREGRLASGVVDEDGVAAARIALWSFRRDTAASKQEKIKQQELIVKVYAKKLSSAKGRIASGLTTNIDVLIATDALLQAKQLLEELRLEEKKS